MGKLGVSWTFIWTVWCPCPEWDPLFKKRKALFLPLQSLSHTSHCSFGSSCRPLGRLGNLFQIKKRPLSFSTFYLALCASATLTSLQFQKHNKYAFGMSHLLLNVTDRCSYQLVPLLLPHLLRSLFRYYL